MLDDNFGLKINLTHVVMLDDNFVGSRWVEEDPVEILESVKVCIEKATENLVELGFKTSDIKGKFVFLDELIVKCHNSRFKLR